MITVIGTAMTAAVCGMGVFFTGEWAVKTLQK